MLYFLCVCSKQYKYVVDSFVFEVYFGFAWYIGVIDLT